MLGLFLCHGLLSSNNLHICNNSRSLNFGAAICNPTGKPNFENPHGSVAAGLPLQLKGAVIPSNM